jgi:hypothetical protein
VPYLSFELLAFFELLAAGAAVSVFFAGVSLFVSLAPVFVSFVSVEAAFASFASSLLAVDESFFA